MNNILNRFSSFRFGLVLLLCYGVFYVGNALSPSSYGVFLNQIGAKSAGLFYGEPRPIRSDEWAVYTPLLQIAINNNFERYNKTSPYHEDLRPSFSLPLKDWSIPFKPALLGFYFLPPAYAFSLYYFIVMALFLTGFALMFRALGLDETKAILFALLVYFSGFTQNWWSVAGPIMAFFSWSYVVLVSKKNFYLRLALFYLFVSWMMFAMFYPVFFYNFAFVVVLLIYCFNRDFCNFKNLSAFGICGVLALLTYLFYIKDSILILANTVYPGQRNMISGGDVDLMQWLSQFFPSLVVNESLAVDLSNKSNVCELSVMGSYLFLVITIFGNWKNYFKQVGREDLRSISILLGGFILFSCWMLLPIPSQFVKIIFLNHIPAIRCFFIVGFLLLVIAVIILRKLEFVLSYKRLILFVLLVVVATAFSAAHYRNFDSEILAEGLMILSPLFLIVMTNRFIFNLNSKHLALILLVAVTANNVVVFGRFNPLQSAKPIFSVPQTEFVKELRDPKNFSSEGFFIGHYMSGTTANGIGLHSIIHVLYGPQLKFFRCYFPELEEGEFNNIFNRYLHVKLDDVARPFNVQSDLSVLPRSRFKIDDESRSQCLEDLRSRSK